MASSSQTSSLSRLDHVFTLLENGASSVVRKAAARELGNVQQKHPHELNHLLAKLLPYLCHGEWDTRIAAAEAIESVINQVPVWEPKSVLKQECSQSNEESKLTFSQFDVDQLLSRSQLLLSSSGDEYQLPIDVEGLNARDRVKKQRKLIEKRMGLTIGGNTSLGVASNELFRDEDLALVKEEFKELSKTEIITKASPNVVLKMNEGMSSRERNRAKRKAKLLMKQMSKDGHREGKMTDERPPMKRRKGDNFIKEDSIKSMIQLDDVPPHDPFPQDWTHWPFDWYCDELLNHLFNLSWEYRHGACLALRNVIKKHGRGSGKESNMDEMQLLQCNQRWLADVAIRLLCVIALDRFADFVSDQAVAPVRESCAQTLSVVVSLMEDTQVYDVIKVLLHLLTKSEWEVRHSAMVSIQYIIAVRQDLQNGIVFACLPSILKGLDDIDGDVRSMSAKSLLPATQLLTSDPQYDSKLKLLLEILWNSLNDYDELTSSTQSVLLLLSKLIKVVSFETMCQGKQPGHLISRLWPFLQHATSSVREASLSTILMMISSIKKKTSLSWLSPICVDGVWNIFQCCLLEPNPHIRSLAVEVFILFVRTCPIDSLLSCLHYIPRFFDLACQPALLPYDNLMLNTEHCDDNQHDSERKFSKNNRPKTIAGVLLNTHSEDKVEEYVMETRESVTRMIGILCCHGLDQSSPCTTDQSTIIVVKDYLLLLMSSQYAVKRIVATMMVGWWWNEIEFIGATFPSDITPELHCAIYKVLSDYFYFTEIATKFCQVQADVKSLLSGLSENGINTKNFPIKPVYSFDDVLEICARHFTTVASSCSQGLHDQRNLLLKLTETSQAMQCTLDCQVKGYAAAAVVSAAHCVGNKDELWKLPEKLNPLIRPLMDSIKKEENSTVRKSISLALAQLLGLCASREPCPNVKLIRNLSSFLTFSGVRCPTRNNLETEFAEETLQTCGVSSKQVLKEGIVTQLRKSEAILTGINKKKKKKLENNIQDQAKITSLTAWKGAAHCLQTICDTYQSSLFDTLPHLWDIVYHLQGKIENGASEMSNGSSMMTLKSLATLEVIVPALHEDKIQGKILSLLPCVVSLLWDDLANIRFLSARCIGVFTKHITDRVMSTVIEKILCNLDVSKDINKRRGAIEATANIIEEMGMSIVTYTVLFIVPLLGCMSDHDTQIRLLSTHYFAQLIQFIPIESGIPDAPNMSEYIVAQKKKDRRFLEQLFDNQSLEAYHIPVTINATLRPYQEDGVKWLAFLNRYKLHGVLCDEMGLGKTLQTICIIASDHHYKMKNHKEENSQEPLNLISLVVCPPTLTGHWAEEIRKFCKDLHPIQYTGNPQERARLQGEVRKHNVIVASYEVVRNDITFFSKIKWNYCILDEGHAIRNGKSKTSQSVKCLLSNHRLILTGTPIQNSVLELWSLFDFLIPGFLGSEQEFNYRYTKPILASRDAKSSSKEQEEGLLAMEALHRQVLPFMLRRMKEDVLQDLPPKIIQDYYCDLSPLQMQLYEDFAKSRAKKNAESSINTIDEEKDRKTRQKGTSHVFQALQYLQKVCNHPLFVLTPTHPQYKLIIGQLKSTNSSLHDIKHATKLMALQQLLLDCGIGVSADSVLEQSVVSQHRALIFCQHKNLLDIIQKDLLTVHMPMVTFLRLDGGVPANERYSIVSRFNNDPSIDVLLLTTKVGGLGLNLTGADTVIFIEHDWNPMVDLQAMDRAHRIGQKRVVNVYRLITRGTLEEKILGLQKFKLTIANTVVGDDNRGLQSMGTNQVLDLFTVNKNTSLKSKSSSESSSRGLRAMMEGLGELWDQNQYDDEYNLDNFIQKL